MESTKLDNNSVILKLWCTWYTFSKWWITELTIDWDGIVLHAYICFKIIHFFSLLQKFWRESGKYMKKTDWSPENRFCFIFSCYRTNLWTDVAKGTLNGSQNSHVEYFTYIFFSEIGRGIRETTKWTGTVLWSLFKPKSWLCLNTLTVIIQSCSV